MSHDIGETLTVRRHGEMSPRGQKVGGLQQCHVYATPPVAGLSRMNDDNVTRYVERRLAGCMLGISTAPTRATTYRPLLFNTLLALA